MKGYMSEGTFGELVDQIYKAGVERVYIVGNGEPTLHPAFSDYVRKLSKATRLLSVTSNWQRIDDAILEAVVEAPVHVMSISVDGCDSLEYEASRVGGSFGGLLVNLRALNQKRRDTLGWPRVIIRVMLRPSQVGRGQRILDFWRPYCDLVSFQYVVNVAGTDHDAYRVPFSFEYYPRCTLLFKQLEVNWNGNVSICQNADRQADQPLLSLLGNINIHPLGELWGHPLLQQYRHAHLTRFSKLMALCKGCIGG